MIPFLKMHGCGNDFVIIDARKHDALCLLDAPQLIARISDRRFGIGCDQFIMIAPHATASAAMLIRNCDGTEAGMCGNAARCVASLLLAETGKAQITLAVGARMLRAVADGENVSVDMGPPHTVSEADIGLNLPAGICVDMGNPHIVFFVDDATQVPLTEIGPRVETHPHFQHKTNVEFASPLVATGDVPRMRMRVWERGAGITLACGSGACAVAVAAMHKGLCHESVNIQMDGGTLNLKRDSAGHIWMTGPVAHVCSGTLAPELLGR